ncbi:MAG TPA: ParA family protein [Azospira sp.]|nr:ParA family protein [Azospira sp.]
MRIAVFNQKGGVGKTTTALNLAAAVSRNGGVPLLLDLDPQCHLSGVFGSAPQDSQKSLFAFYQDLKNLQQLEIPWDGLGTLIPSHQQLIKVDSIFGKGPAILNKLRVGLDALDQQQPGRTLFMDCCPYVGVLSLNALFACDYLLIPVSTDYLSLKAAEQMTRTLEILEPVIKRRISRRYVLTRYDRRRRMSQDVRDRLTSLFGMEVCETVIGENVAVAESPSLQRDVFTHSVGSSGAKDYRALYDELREQGFF